MLSPLVLVAAAVLSADPPPPVKLAAPGFRAVQLSEDVVRFYSEHFAQQLVLNGLQVITASQVSTLVGMERQRQLMGCSDESCMAELAGALGVDAVITGNIGKFGTAYQVNISIIASNDGRILAAHAQKLRGEEEVLDALNTAAREIAPKVRDRLGRNPKGSVSPTVGTAATASSNTGPAAAPSGPRPPEAWKRYWWAPTGAGAVALGVGGFFFYRTAQEYDRVTEWRTQSSGTTIPLSSIKATATRGAEAQVLAFTLTGVGVAAAGVGLWMLATQGSTAPSVSLVAGPDGAMATLSGTLP